MATSIEDRLQELLDLKVVEVEDDGVLPVPRLELVYQTLKPPSWGSCIVTYRLVMRHLLGHLEAIPLSFTRIGQSGARSVDDIGLPRRDGAHIAHDRVHLGMPAFKVVPGKPPERMDLDDYRGQAALGAEHRREGSV